MKTPTLRSMYAETDRVVEKWTKLALVLFSRVTPVLFVYSKAILIYLIYYTTDAKRDAFDLPYSMWLVVNWLICLNWRIAIDFAFL